MPPHVLMLSDRETVGGAAVAASWLASGLAESGIRVTRVVAKPEGRANPWSTIRLAPAAAGPVSARLAVWRSLPSIVQRSLQRRSREAFRLLLDELRPDVVNVHNMHNAEWAGWTLDLLRDAQAAAPVVWTLHDMWSFTGRCAYSYDCERYLTRCTEECPTASEYPRLRRSEVERAWREKVEFLSSSTNLTAVTPSRWLAGRATAGGWRGQPVRVIPYGVPTSAFQPYGQDEARERLGLPRDGILLLYASIDLRDRRKGGALVGPAVQGLRDRATLVTMGRHALPDVGGVPVHRLGYIESIQTKALIYSAADALLFPSLSDNLPLTVLESLACGTPVIACRTGGVEEVVRAGETGWLADGTSAGQLRSTVAAAIADLTSGTNLRPACRRLIESFYDSAIAATEYRSLFETLSNGRRSPGTTSSSELTSRMVFQE